MARYGLAVGLALLVSAALVAWMQVLIADEGNALAAGPSGSAVDFVRLRRQVERAPPSRRLPPKPPPKPQPPATPSLGATAGPQVAMPLPVQALAPPSLGRSVRLGGRLGVGLGDAVVDQEAIPLVRVRPMYPRRAELRGLEGWVDVELAIDAKGAVVEAEVVGEKPAHVFGRAALNAVKRWRYQPKTQGGKPVPQSGIRVRIEFELER